MTFENRALLLAKVGFLAVLTTLIVFAGNIHTHPNTQAVQNIQGR